MKSTWHRQPKATEDWHALSSTAQLLALQHTTHENETPESPTKKQHHDPRPAQYSMIQLVDILRYMPDKYRPLIPYILTLELFKHHTDACVRQVYYRIYPRVNERHFDHSTTSCINSALSVVSLFSSSKTATHLQMLSNKRKIMHYTLALPSAKPWNFSIRNLFAGSVVSLLQTENPDYASEIITTQTYDRYAIRVNDTFFASLREEANRCRAQIKDDDAFIKTMKAYLVTLEFNGPTIMMMREHITQNNHKTHSLNSHLYFMSCAMPDKKVHHAFVLEQFFCPATESVRFRLYQSWLKRSTLHETLREQFSHRYSQSWDQAELYQFIEKLALFYSNSKTEQISEHDTFGLGKRSTNKLFASTFFTDELVGIGFEYFCQAMDPGKCLDHLLEIAGEKSALRDALQVSDPHELTATPTLHYLS